MNMMFYSILIATLALLTPPISATTLYTTNYDGTVATLALNRLRDGSYSFTRTANIKTCGNLPSWLTYDSKASTLYCSDESNNPNGTLTSYTPISSGIKPQISIKTVGGGVASVQYGGKNGNSYLAIAHYQDSAVSTFALPLTTSSTAKQVFTYTLPHPGPNPVRQDVPHIHETLLDPRKSFIFATDLGADLVRVFSINNHTGSLSPCPAYTSPPGSGPRHGAFKVLPCGKTVFYLGNELANNVTAIEVKYPSAKGRACPTFKPFQTIYTTAHGGKSPVGSKLAEVRVVGDNVYVTNRNTSSSRVDTLTTFSLNKEDGELKVLDVTSTVGSWPRTLAFNKNGTLAAVGNQDSGTVVVFAREPRTGVLHKTPVARVVAGSTGVEDATGLSSVIFAE